MNDNYKLKCYNVFSFDNRINILMNCLNNNLFNNSRIIMYEIEDDLVNLMLTEELHPGETSIHNARINTLKKINECIDEIEEYIIQSEYTYNNMIKNENSNN